MATASKTPKSTTPRKRTPKSDAAPATVPATTTVAETEPAAVAKADVPKPAKPPKPARAASAAAKPAAKARPKRAAKAPAPATKVKKRSAFGKIGFATVAATGLGAIGAIAFGLLRSRKPSEPGTTPTDLMGDSHPDGSQRAIEQFRPDPTAPIPDSERDAFRPALAGGSAPTLVAGQADELRRADAAPS
jgi:hypothetical protein